MPSPTSVIHENTIYGVVNANANDVTNANNVINEIVNVIHIDDLIEELINQPINKNGKRKKNEKHEKSENVINSKTKKENELSNDKRSDNNIINNTNNTSKKNTIVKKREELSMKNYNNLLTVKYKLDELKKLCLQYKITRVGNKEELTNRLYEYCKNSVQPIKIQKVFRGYLQRKLNKLRGPAFKNRKICTNDTDFYTMDEMDEISATQFYSYKDEDDFIYGFNIISLYNLIIKEGNGVKNPYNRNEITNKVKQAVTSVILLSKILKQPIEIEIKNEIVDPKKRMELKILDLFQTINSYGNYANSEWFSDLTRQSHIRFARELVDIWNYRAQLSHEKKNEICPPHGTPFLGTPYFTNIASPIHLNNLSIETLIKYNVQIIENLVKSAIDIDNKMLGSFYVLSALTLVSQQARDAMPWLYESVVYIP
jgi:hypothetical protein